MTASKQDRTIAHALFTYTDVKSGAANLAFRGETVTLSDEDVERGEKFEAFTATVGEKPESQGSSLPDYPAEGGDAEQDAWVVAGTVNEIIAAVRLDPSIAPSVIRAEERRKSLARKTLLAALAQA